MMSIFAGAKTFAFSQGPIQALSLTGMPGMEFGLKAHNLGVISASRGLGRTVAPGVAILQTGEAGRDDKASVVQKAVSWLEKKCKKKLGAAIGHPLLLAVRSSPQKSAPGKAKSVIYLGMNEAACHALSREVSPDTAFRTYAWFLRNYARDVCARESPIVLPAQKPDGMSWEEYTGILLHEISRAGLRISDDPREQLMDAYDAVRGSMYEAGMSGGVLVQEAVVIDDDPLSGAGVYFTRSPNDGAPRGMGRVAYGSAGADVVMGEAGVEFDVDSPAGKRLSRVTSALEKLFGDPLDVEFAQTRGALYLLQARPLAFGDPEIQVRVWQDMVRGGLMAAREYPRRVFALQEGMPSDVHSVSDVAQLGAPIGKGRGVCGSYAARGKIVPVADIASGEEPSESRIIFTDDPNAPKVIDAVWKRRVAGVVTSGGHDFSHIAIMARALKIPMLINFDGDVARHMGQDVILDEATGALYRANEAMDAVLKFIPQNCATGHFGIDPESIQQDVLRDIANAPVGAIARWHDTEIEMSIRRSKKGNFAEALRHTWRAHFLHLELDRLNNRSRPFTVYVWDNTLPSQIYETIRVGSGISDSHCRAPNWYSSDEKQRIRAFIAEKPDLIDPMFAALSQHYGDRLRLEVSFRRQCGQFCAQELVRVSAVAEGGDPFIRRWEMPVNDPLGAVMPSILRYFGWDPEKDVKRVRREAEDLVQRIPGAQYVEYNLVHKWHDRGVLMGTKVIGVLPPGYSAQPVGS